MAEHSSLNTNEESFLMSKVNVSELQKEKFEKYDRISKLTHQTFEYEEIIYDFFIDGESKKSTIVTLHDIGQNSSIAFGEYFSQKLAEPILDDFQIIHITLPGQYCQDVIMKRYPSFDEISCGIVKLLEHLDKSYIVGFGIGAGANILIRCYLQKQSLFSRLIFINGYIAQMGWLDWFYQKYYTHADEQKNLNLNSKLTTLLLDHNFTDIEPNDFSYEYYLNYLESLTNTTNLKLLLESYANRSAIHLSKPQFHVNTNTRTQQDNIISCQVLFLLSDKFPLHEDCIHLISLIDPSLVETIEFPNSHAFILNMCQMKVTRAIILFLQGMGLLRNVELRYFLDSTNSISSM